MKFTKMIISLALAAAVSAGFAAASAAAYSDGNIQYNDYGQHVTIDAVTRAVVKTEPCNCFPITSIRYDGTYAEITWQYSSKSGLLNDEKPAYHCVVMSSRNKPWSYRSKIYFYVSNSISSDKFINGIYVYAVKDQRVTFNIPKAIEQGLLKNDEDIKFYVYSYDENGKLLNKSHDHFVKYFSKMSKTSVSPVSCCDDMQDAKITGITVTPHETSIDVSWDGTYINGKKAPYNDRTYTIACAPKSGKLIYIYTDKNTCTFEGLEKDSEYSIFLKDFYKSEFDLNDERGIKVKTGSDTVTGTDEPETEKTEEIAPAAVKIPEKLAAAKNIKLVKAAKTAVQLKWDAADGADAYEVYVYNSSSKKYEKYKTVSGTSCTVKNLKSGKKYKIKVVTLDKVNGKYVQGGSKTATVSTKK